MSANPAFLPRVPTVRLLIGGRLVESRTTEWRDIVNPATQEVLARVPFATADEIDQAIASAKAAFKTCARHPSARGPASS